MPDVASLTIFGSRSGSASPCVGRSEHCPPRRDPSVPTDEVMDTKLDDSAQLSRTSTSTATTPSPALASIATAEPPDVETPPEESQASDPLPGQRSRPVRRIQLDLSPSQVAGGSLAAATAAALSSTLGVAGTIVGAAVFSLITAVVGALYTQSLRRTRTRMAAAAHVARRRTGSGGGCTEWTREEHCPPRLSGRGLSRRGRRDRARARNRAPRLVTAPDGGARTPCPDSAAAQPPDCRGAGHLRCCGGWGHWPRVDYRAPAIRWGQRDHIGRADPQRDRNWINRPGSGAAGGKPGPRSGTAPGQCRTARAIGPGSNGPIPPAEHTHRPDSDPADADPARNHPADASSAGSVQRFLVGDTAESAPMTYGPSHDHVWQSAPRSTLGPPSGEPRRRQRRRTG